MIAERQNCFMLRNPTTDYNAPPGPFIRVKEPTQLAWHLGFAIGRPLPSKFELASTFLPLSLLAVRRKRIFIPIAEGSDLLPCPSRNVNLLIQRLASPDIFTLKPA